MHDTSRTHLSCGFLELLDLPGVDAPTFVDQVAGGGGLAAVHVADNDDVNVGLLLSHGEGFLRRVTVDFCLRLDCLLVIFWFGWSRFLYEKEPHLTINTNWNQVQCFFFFFIHSFLLNLNLIEHIAAICITEQFKM